MKAPAILVVDDDSFLLAVLKRTLVRAGYAVVAEADPTTALANYKRGARFDLIISDLEMPGLHGDELCREVQKIAPTPFILVSGSLEVHARGQACGATRTFDKPYTMNTILACTAELIWSRLHT